MPDNNQNKFDMKKAIMFLACCFAATLGFNLYLSHELYELKMQQLEQQYHIEALNSLVHALDYKKNAQLYMLCSNPSENTLKLLADSCKADCIKYKQGK